MSNLTILGDTSGSVVLQAPAIAGSTTLTLPSTSGTVLTTASTGTVLQVVQTISQSTNSTANTSMTQLGPIVTITPKRSNSNFLVTFNSGRVEVNAGSMVLSVWASVNGGSYAAFGTNSGAGTANSLESRFSATNDWQGSWTWSGLYIPSTSISTISFAGYGRNNGYNASTLSNSDSNGYASCVATVMEIAV